MKGSFFNFKRTVFFSILFCATFSGHAQILDYQNKVSVVLNDGTNVTLYGRASNEKVPGTDNYKMTGDYFYLPVNMRLSMKQDNSTPEFLLLKYATDERTDAGGVQGALLHFLMEWGLTKAQETDLQAKITEKIKDLGKTNPLFAQVSNPKVFGPVDLTAANESSFKIISATLSDKTMAPSVVTSGRAPVMEGAKVAVASRLDKNGAQLLNASLEKNRSITDVSVEMSFGYSLLFPAVRGKIIVDWSKFRTAYERFAADFSHESNDKGGEDDTYSYDEVKSIYSRAIETKAITIEIDKNTTDDALANKVVEEFMNVMLSAITDKADQNDRPQQPSTTEAAADPDIKVGRRYRLSKTKFESHSERKLEIYNLSYRLAIPQTMAITENLASWYDGVRDNPQCVSSVLMNDKFFQHRDINLVLSEGAEQLIGKEVNYVTVNVRKKRSSGADFEKSVTIDREYLKKNGIKASFSYSRGEDNNTESFEYQSQWSFRDGEVFPEQSPWIKGSWEGVPLTLPVKPRTIELECDIDELKAAGITRATLQLRYMKLGKEMETNLPITVSKNENLVKATIFTDPQTRGYAYRLIFNHKDEGKLALEWDAKINDDYVYVSIPEALKDKTSELFRKASEIGKVFSESADGKVGEVSKVLDKFKDVIGIVNN